MDLYSFASNLDRETIRFLGEHYVELLRVIDKCERSNISISRYINETLPDVVHKQAFLNTIEQYRQPVYSWLITQILSYDRLENGFSITMYKFRMDLTVLIGGKTYTDEINMYINDIFITFSDSQLIFCEDYNQPHKYFINNIVPDFENLAERLNKIYNNGDGSLFNTITDWRNIYKFLVVFCTRYSGITYDIDYAVNYVDMVDEKA